MKFKTFMLIAGETSGDMLGAELVQELRRLFREEPAAFTRDYQPLQSSLDPRFFGAGGPEMKAAGVELAFDLTAHSVIGLSDVLKKYLKFRELFNQLLRLAKDRRPDAIICIDFSGFNRRFAHAVKCHIRSRSTSFHDWNPKIIQYVSPQVWASREGRIYQMERDYDLVLSIFPFEKDWYARRVPRLPVEFVGHPLIDRYAKVKRRLASSGSMERVSGARRSPKLLLLPGSRSGEIARHLPILLHALQILRDDVADLRVQMVLPRENLVQQAKEMGLPKDFEVQVGGLPDALRQADVAIASTGTVTMECAFFGVPTVTLYKTSWSTYQIGKRIVTVNSLSMPNILANETLYPEFIQSDATPENIARAALELLRSEPRRGIMQAKLGAIVSTLGSPGASRRAAMAILNLFKNPGAPISHALAS